SRLAIGSGLATDPDPLHAVEAACADARAGLGGAVCDLAVVFLSPHHIERVGDAVAALHAAIRPRVLIGCTGMWIVGGAREVEDAPAVSVFAAGLPDTQVVPFALEYARTPDGETFLGWPDELPADATALALADPFTFPTDDWLGRLADTHPALAVIGGMASGGRTPGHHRLIADTEVRNGGCVGVLIGGRVKLRSLVSQGCKPVGRPYAVTAAERNVMLSLGGSTPIERIRETYAAADAPDREAMQLGLHVGRVVDEYKTAFGRGDFVIRNVLGADESSGAVAVGDVVTIGETVQFHVRDAASADEDLRSMVGAAPRPEGALLFTCNGRGTRLFGVPDHDAAIVSDSFGAPLAGFFCNGEIGPVGGRNFLHGFTASLALFYDSASGDRDR
ncbi:MAG: FIST C-terminal domain-containing protein, partial [Chloroflexi bacterium]|nr:FIST C-terminal domain-containing protein [Chloroflexota bacterium]